MQRITFWTTIEDSYRSSKTTTTKMKLLHQKNPVIRLQFGSHTSLTFSDTTIDEVYDLFIAVFRNEKIERTIKVEGSALNKPEAISRLVCQVRDGSHKQKSKSKSIYGLSDEEAKEFFLKHYEKYL